MASTVQRSSNGTLKKLKLKCVQYEVKEPGLISEYYFFGGGDTPPAETADSGLSSDGTGEGFTPPPLIRRMTASNNNNAGRPSGEEDSQSDVSADSLASEISSNSSLNDKPVIIIKKTLPSSLLKEIRLKAGQPDGDEEDGGGPAVKDLGKAVDQLKLAPNNNNNKMSNKAARVKVNIIPANNKSIPASLDFELYRFHLRENVVSLPDLNNCSSNNANNEQNMSAVGEDLSFVGLKDIMNLDKSATIRSHKSGTVRGVRNRVRAGITTYLQGKTFKSYAEREHGKVVVYTTSMGVVRQTYQRCLQVQRILGTLLINYEERDVSMNRQVQQELKERMNRNRIVIPQVFVEGQLLGDADVIEKLNESGDLRQILRRYKRIGPETICDTCGGYRYLPCSVCSGSKKSIHRNHFTAEFVALKCITCNEAGLVRCNACYPPSSAAD